MDSEDENELDVVNFLACDSDSDCESNDKKQEPKNIISEKCSEVVQMQIKNRMSHVSTARMTDLMNSMPNASIKIPKNPMKYVATNIDFQILFNCESCDDIVVGENKCDQCNREFRKNSKQNNFIVYIPLEPQILRLLNKYFHEIMGYLNREHKKDTISDIDDGKLYKEICEKNPHVRILGFTLNTDGASIYKSSKGSLWPVQLYANFLHPKIRYLPENIIISTLYYGSKKIDMNTLLYPLAAEFTHLSEKLIIFRNENNLYSFRPTVILGVFDLPARADIQCMKAPTGKYACPFCLHPGEPIKNCAKKTTIRYIQKPAQELRTHSDTVQLVSLINENKTHENGGKKDSIYGVKANSAMLLFDDIDVIRSVPVDAMHGVYLGIMRDMVEIWLGKKKIPNPPYKEYKIKSVESRLNLSNRIKNLKPTINFHRKPRSILEISNLKASELMDLMLYYLRYSLVGILHTKIVKHFEKIAAATYILCKKEIQINEIHTACDMLKEFAVEYEEIYGTGSITMNIHLLNHYLEMILNCGPLWSYNMFGFENNIGHLKNLVCGPTDVLNQIATKYVKSLDKTDVDHAEIKPETCLYQRSTIDLKQEYKNIFSQNPLPIWRRIRINGIVYSSTSAVATKSIDYFVHMTDDRIGKIQFFYGHIQTPKLLLQVFERSYQNFHWTEIKATDMYKIYDCKAIFEKLLYFNTGIIEYITGAMKLCLLKICL